MANRAQALAWLLRLSILGVVIGLGVLVAVVMFLCSVDLDLIMAELVAAAGVGLVGGRLAVGV